MVHVGIKFVEITEALEIVIQRTGHVRYRELCDPAHPAYNPAYIPIVLAMAADLTGAAPAPIPIPPAPGIPLAGDLIASATHRFGADRLARWVAAQLGTDCGCPERQARLNALDARLRRYLSRQSGGR